MFIHTEETLEELEDYIKQLEEKHGLSAKTSIEVYKAINKERKQLKKLNIADVVVSFYCGAEHNGGSLCETQCLGCDGFDRECNN